MANPKDTLETQERQILAFLSDDKVKTVILFGEAGVGKTWMAKKISNSSSHKGSSYGTIWVVPEYKYEAKSLVEYIAIQLSVLPSKEEWKENDNAEMMEHQERELEPENLKQKIGLKLEAMKMAKLEGMKTAMMNDDQTGAPGAGKDPYLLVVLDDLIDQTILADLNDLFQHESRLKFIITRRGSDSEEGDGDIQRDHIIPYKTFRPHVDSLNLLQNRAKPKVQKATGFRRLSAAIGNSSSAHPGAIIIIAEAMNRVENFELDNATEEAASIIESANIKALLQHVYNMLPSTLNKCCWHCRYLFHHDKSASAHDKSIHYNELITHWLLEGYFDHHDHIEKAYEEARHTLIELTDRGFLGEKENSYVYMESDALRVTDHRRDGLSGSACVGMASVLNDRTWDGLGRVIHTDGMIKTNNAKRSEMSTLLTYGARFCREVSESFFQHIRLRVLVILNPIFKKLPSPLSELKELQILVLRGCRLLKNVDEICELTKLLVLEISGASLVKKIHDDLFERMKDLRSLNLSEIGVTSLPASILNRSELCWLILRNCPYLEQLCDSNLLRKKEVAKQGVLSLAKLEVLDLSGSASFRNIQVKTLAPLQKLQILNLSETKIGRMPFFSELGELTRLLLSDCPNLAKLPNLTPLTKLQILDLSKTKSLKEVEDDSPETKTDFRVLDLSGSAVNKLPCNISHLSHLLLSGCSDLPRLPSTRGLQGLEELNLSDASSLEEFEDDSFEHLTSLRRLTLSITNIKALPSLPRHSELRSLLLRDCKSLTKLPKLSTLQKLEVLDLSGCSALVITSTVRFRGMSLLKKIDLSGTQIKSLPRGCFPISLRHLIIRNCPDWNDLPSLEDLSNLEVLDLCGAESMIDINLGFLSRMSKLRILNLSEVKFEQLPSLSHLANLRELSLRGCSCKVSELDALKELELLDLSGTKVESLPSLETFSNLRQLLLRDCADLEDLQNLKSLAELEVLDLSGTKIKEFPYEIWDLTSLRKLSLQDMKHIKEIDWNKIKYIPEEFDLGNCESLSSENSAFLDWPPMSICGTTSLEFVMKNVKSWEKFHLSVWLPKIRNGRTHDLGDRGVLMDIKSQGRIPYPEQLGGRCLEIHGSCCFSNLSEHTTKHADPEYRCVSNLPEGILEHADHISLVDNAVFSRLSELVKENFRSMKSCWLDRCTNIQNIIAGEEDAIASRKLEFLHLCNLSSLEHMCDDKVESKVFEVLNSLYVDCCPMLTNILPLSKLPVTLETLQIKFCDKLERLFMPDASEECKLQNSDILELPECNLWTLDLLELPNLKGIGVKMGSLRVLKVRQCPKLEKLEEVLGEGKNLLILHISFVASLKIVKLGSCENLKQLKIESCPELKEVSPSSELLPNLETLEISSCQCLETIFSGSSAGSSLKRLRLCGLPSLSKTGFKVQPGKHVVRDCPKLHIDDPVK